MKETQLATSERLSTSFSKPANNVRGFENSFLKHLFWKVAALLPFSLAGYSFARAFYRPPSTAFFYGSPVPVDALSKFERVVVEAENLDDIGDFRIEGIDVFAYVSVGEAEGWRASSCALPNELFLGNNAAWGSRIADLTQPNWRRYLIENRMAVLWGLGYNGFFLDTLESYQSVVKSHAEQRAQSTALIEIICCIHQRFPGVKLLLNRGFEVLPKIGSLAVGLVAESLFQSWNQTTQKYISVSSNDHRWLLRQLNQARRRYGLPITVIDYVPPDMPELARETARRISALGFASWVATPGLDMLSVGVTP